ncbi:MAG: hypothetical protein ACKO96_18730, partial [Flammeovirgaceae bacterium]
WLSPKRFGWFDHFVDHVPITNNALESTNRYIKDQGTFTITYFSIDNILYILYFNRHTQKKTKRTTISHPIRKRLH